MKPRDLFEALVPVVAALESLGVRHYVAGSLASTSYGRVRTTQDVDLVADLAPPHADPLAKALQGDYYADVRAMADAIARRSCFNVIHLATSFKVDVFTVRAREYDRVALQRIRPWAIDRDDPSYLFFVASAEDVVLSKLEWFRLGDEVSQTQWLDVMSVLKIQGDVLDRAYLEKWAAALGVADLLTKAWIQSRE